MTTTSNSIRILFAAALLLFSSHLFAQNKDKNNSPPPEGDPDYKTSFGLRGGFEGGVTLKHFIKDEHALEFILSAPYHYRGYRLTGLYEIQRAIPGAAGLCWFVGAGAHIGSYDYGYYGYYGWNGTGYYDKHGNWHSTGYYDHYTVFGLDLIIGIEYKFQTVPFTVGLDLKPFFDFINRGDNYGDGAFTVRYIFK